MTTIRGKPPSTAPRPSEDAASVAGPSARRSPAEPFVNVHLEKAASSLQEKYGPLPLELLLAESVVVSRPDVAKLPSIEAIQALEDSGKKVLFSEKAVREALSLGNKEEEFQRREKVQGVVFSIDSYETKDLDNALSFRVNEEGHSVVGVHSVDLNTWLRGAGALNHFARLRKETRYLKDAGLVVPMLPLSLCEGKLSLFEGQARLTKSMELTFDEGGNLLSARMFRSQLVNQHQVDEQDASLAREGKGRGATHPAFAEALRGISNLATRVSGNANPNQPMKLEKVLSFFTILAASEVGRQIKEADLDTTFRNQKEKNAKSWFGEKAEGHASLNVDAYASFTAPMRRYADLDVQRIMDLVIDQRKMEGRKKELDASLRKRQLERLNGVLQEARMQFTQELVSATRKPTP